MNTTLSKDLRCLILNYKEPFVIKDILKWDILNWDLEQWSLILNNEKLVFRAGKYKYTTDPQWERTTEVIKQTFQEFTELDVAHTKQWLYFDYKYLNEFLKNKSELHNSICWDMLGFPEFSSEESTLWIGSEGAHTPCHKDTYGCNLVAQIYGRKRWIIFSPEENLYATRIPYEESSIYSKLNFFSPNNIEKFQDIKTCKSVILEPGDILFVPNGWWHYVENLEIAISINTWIPLSTDPQKQLAESIVQMFVSQIIKDLDTVKQRAILNPNMEELNLQRQDLSSSINVVNMCKQNCKIDDFKTDCSTNLKEFFDKYEKNLLHVPNLSKHEFINLIQGQINRFDKDDRLEECNEVLVDSVKDIIDAFVHEDVVNLIVMKLLDNKK